MGFLFFRQIGGERRLNMDAVNQRKKIIGRIVRKGHPVRLTSLLFLKEALLEENYEMCADLIAIAKEFGAKDFEIQNLLEDARRTPT